MRLNGTIFQKGFRSELESFKTGLVARMKYDFVRMIEDTSKTRPQKGNLTLDEKIDFMDKLQTEWSLSLNKEIKSWSAGTFSKWILRAQDAWIGFENVVKDNLLKLKTAIERHRHSNTNT
jgi:hypothetical protein